MKFIPILFSTPMVQAILEGRKTMTRRVMKGPYMPEADAFVSYGGEQIQWIGIRGNVRLSPWVKCPYGQPGDVLWVRESWCHNTMPTGWPYHYRAANDTFSDPENERWKPSIHMPKAACRIFLEVVSVRVERLQELNRGDAMAEGCPFPNMARGINPKDWFQGLWQSINGPESWQENPWVWVVEFKRVENPENFLD
jgi:hypothetical protein